MQKKIDWKRGAGSTILGMTLLMVCFTLALVVMEYGNLFYKASKSQIVSDTVADGATVYAQTPLGLDEMKLRFMASELISRNRQNSVRYTLYPPVVTDDTTRAEYNDKIVNVHLEAATPSLIMGSGNGMLEVDVGSQVRALSRLKANVQLTTTEEQIVLSALSSLDPSSPQYAALMKSVTMLGWIYNDAECWTEGYCNNASFVIQCYLAAEENYGVSGNCLSVMSIAVSNGWMNYWADGITDVSALQPGDVLYWQMNDAVNAGIPLGLGHIGIYLGEGKIIHASSTAGRVVITNIFGDTWTNADGKLIGYSRQVF